MPKWYPFFNKTIYWLLLAFIILNLALFFKQNGAIYLKPFDPEFYKDIYGKSQYVRQDPLAVVPDEYVYSHAAWEYMHGTNPALFNADQPPLGKYFIGIGEVFFNNEKIVSPTFNILSLIALFFLAKMVLNNTNLALALTALFSFEKLFIVQMIYAPLLDNIQLFFILLAFIFYIKSLKDSKFLIPAFLMLGCVMSVKFWATGFVIYIIWFLHKILVKDKKIFRFLYLTPTLLISMILVYLPSFIQGDSLRRFFGVQKYIFEFHRAKIHFDPTAIWDLLLLNRWHVPWDGTIRPSVDWQLTWPFLTILSVTALLFYLNKKFKSQNTDLVLLVIIWLVIYFILLTFGAVVARYLIPVLPAMYLLSFLVVKLLYETYLDKRIHKLLRK